MPTYNPILLMDDNAGSQTVLDSSGNGAHGTVGVNTSTLHVAGPGGTLASGLTSNAINFVQLASAKTITTTGTGSAACWAKSNAVVSDGVFTLFGEDADATVFFVDPDGVLRVIDNGGTQTWSKDISAMLTGNGWHHYGFVFNANGTSSVYIDGALLTPDSSTARLSNVVINTLWLAVGVGNGDVSMADWRYSTSAITAGDMATLYALGVTSGGALTGPSVPAALSARQSAGLSARSPLPAILMGG